MSEFLSSKELFINMKNVPIWDPRKSYFDQDPVVLQFYKEEFKKITEGVTIGGFYIHPWLYWHINFFKTPIPVFNKKMNTTSETIIEAPLDDNTLYVVESYQEAEKADLGLALFGTRGATKSTWLASLSSWTATTRPNGVMSIVGGSDGDLSSISRLLQTSLENVNEAFRLNRIRSNWDSHIDFGLKDKNNTDLLYSHISITNANKGSKKESEKGAGLSPVGFIADEIGKWNPIGILQSAIPSFMTPYGQKLVHVLAGTTGNRELSRDAKKILTNPAEFRLLLTNWDSLERNIPEEAITWKHNRKDKFSVFMPGQMSYRLEVPKKETTLADYFGQPMNLELKNVSINVTDWQKATKVIKEKIEVLKDVESKEKQRMYYPLSIDDVFLTESANPFPTTIIRNHIKKLEDEGRIGKDVEIYSDGSKFKSEFVKKKRASVKHEGGEADAPTIVYQDIPDDKPPRDVFVSGLDDYKLEQSDTDSLGSIYVLKRRRLEPNSPCETIAASYTARPYRHRDFHRSCEKLIDAYNAECCMESIDISFVMYLDNKNKAEQSLAPSFSFTSATSKSNSKLNSRYGLYPNKANNEYRFNLLIDFCKEEHIVDHDQEGNPIIKYGVEFLEDIGLLKEMLNYKKGDNFDRITAFSHALVYARELDKKNVRPREKKQQDNIAHKRRKTTINKYGRASGLKRF
jgi:hypothetical protein